MATKQAKPKPKAKKINGRPTKYKKDYDKLLVEFFSQEADQFINIEHFKNGEVSWVDKKPVAGLLPTVVGFCKTIRINRDTFYEWVKVHKSFSDTFKWVKALQKDFLIQSGLSGRYNPIFSKFVAINLTDMVDKKEVEHSGGLSLTQILNEAGNKESK
jgi:hypothetical protein